MSKSAFLAGACAVAILVPAAGQRAEARIHCQGAYQVIEGSLHATPYCEDNYLAEVARGYGLHVSNEAVRHNPSVKAEVCYTIGHDARVSDICAAHRRDGKNRR